MAFHAAFPRIGNRAFLPKKNRPEGRLISKRFLMRKQEEWRQEQEPGPSRKGRIGK